MKSLDELAQLRKEKRLLDKSNDKSNKGIERSFASSVDNMQEMMTTVMSEDMTTLMDNLTAAVMSLKSEIKNIKIDIPQIKIPAIATPVMPEIKMPEIKIPKSSIKVSLPKIEVPKVTVNLPK